MRKRLVKGMLCASLCAIGIAGTSVVGYASVTGETTSVAAGERRERPEDDGSQMAKVSAVDDDELTVMLSEKPAMDGQAGEKPADGETPPEKPADGETPPEKPADGETPPEKPADGETPPEKPADGETPPEKPDGGQGAAGGHPEMSFSGESTTVKVTSSTQITKGPEKAAAALSDIDTDSIIRIVLDGDTAVSIEIMDEGAEAGS